MTTLHSDMMFGKGVLGNAIRDISEQAFRDGSEQAWRTAHDKLLGIDYLWISYRSTKKSDVGLYESMALNNAIKFLMGGLPDENRVSYPGVIPTAEEVRAGCKQVWEDYQEEFRKRQFEEEFA